MLTHLDRLEAESIFIFREVVATCARPVMLYSAGKDSSVMLRLAQKAFAPAPIPFPLLHIDTGWKFREMIAFRDRVARETGARMLVWTNEEKLNPFETDAQHYTHVMKTVALRQALDHHRFDAAFGGGRRDEEKSRAKERVFSVRDAQHQWNPHDQRPELWNLYNTRLRPGESARVFPLSNWTELDVWLYIERESIPVVPLYFAAERPVVEREGTWLMVDDERWRTRAEEATPRCVRFRTLGCFPLTGAVESRAATPADVIQELLSARHSERTARLIDGDGAGSMERKKREGYF